MRIKESDEFARDFGIGSWVGLLGVLVLALVGVTALVRRFADGPIGPLPGGRLQAESRIHDEAVDGSIAEDVNLVELQLVEPLGSRMTGILVHEGRLYVLCDLGFIWHRVSPPAKWAMAFVVFVKRWHKDVLKDGRGVIRFRGRRFEREAVKVTDRALLLMLRGHLESRAEIFISKTLGESVGEPGEVWFFRLDPRSR